MSHKTFALALVIGLAALPLACGDDDDDTGGTAGSGGKAGSSGTAGSAGKGGAGGKGGTGGTGGKGGTTGTSGSSAGGEGGSGTGNTGNVGGEPNGGTEAGGAGAGGESGAAGGGGEGGAGEDPAAAARLEKLQTLCAQEVYFNVGDTSSATGQCEAHGDADCADLYADITGYTPSCVETFDDLLDCALTAPPEDFFCDEANLDAGGFEGKIGFDGLSADLFDVCPEFDTWTACKPTP
jgi:hypothetical protein